MPFKNNQNYFYIANIWIKKKLMGNYTRKLRAVFKKSWKRHPLYRSCIFVFTNQPALSR